MQKQWLTTRDFAAQTGYSEAYIRTRLCVRGTFHGVSPQRQPGGRLLWPLDSAAVVLAQGRTAPAPRRSGGAA
jgi:hypothetical protein